MRAGSIDPKVDLPPCPFCARKDLLGVERHPENKFLSIRCRACGCIGPANRAESVQEAMGAWMRRSNPPSPAYSQEALDTGGKQVSNADIIACKTAFGPGPFHVERRTNSHAEICDKAGKAIAQCTWTVDAARNAEVLCQLLNQAVGDAKSFYSQEALDAAVAEERQYWKDAAEAMALEAEYKIGGGAVADWLRSLVAKRGK